MAAWTSAETEHETIGNGRHQQRLRRPASARTTELDRNGRRQGWHPVRVQLDVALKARSGGDGVVVGQFLHVFSPCLLGYGLPAQCRGVISRIALAPSIANHAGHWHDAEQGRRHARWLNPSICCSTSA